MSALLQNSFKMDSVSNYSMTSPQAVLHKWICRGKNPTTLMLHLKGPIAFNLWDHCPDEYLPPSPSSHGLSQSLGWEVHTCRCMRSVLPVACSESKMKILWCTDMCASSSRLAKAPGALSDASQLMGSRFFSCALVPVAISLCVLLVSLLARPNGPGEVVAQRPLGPEELSVMSFNIRYGDANDGIDSWPQRKYVAARMLDLHSPDIIGMQECLHWQTADLIRLVKKVQYNSHASNWNSILYNSEKFLQETIGHLWLSESRLPESKSWGASSPRLLTWTILVRKADTARRPILVFNTHLDVTSRLAREKGTAMIAETIAIMWAQYQARAPLLVLTGDFNTMRGSQAHAFLAPLLSDSLLDAEAVGANTLVTYHHFLGAEISDAWWARVLWHMVLRLHPMGPRWDSPNFAVYHLDWIMYLGFTRVPFFTVILYNEDKRYPTDHLPVLAHLRI